MYAGRNSATPRAIEAYERVVQIQPTGQANHLAGDVVGGHGRDKASGGAQGVDLSFRIREPPVPPVDFAVDDQVGQRPGVVGQRQNLPVYAGERCIVQRI